MTNMRRLNPPEDRPASPAAEFVLNELMKVAAYALLPEEDRGSIAVAVAHIGAKSYLDGRNRERHREDLDCRSLWIKGCWVGSQVAGVGIR